MAYLDTKLVAMLNEANGISIENYIVKAEKIRIISDVYLTRFLRGKTANLTLLRAKMRKMPKN